MIFDEKERGSLKARKIADMAILSQNPCEEESCLKNLKVEQLSMLRLIITKGK